MTEANGHHSRLLDHHYHDLQSSGLNDETVRLSRCASETDADKLASRLNLQAGLTKTFGPTILIPYFGIDGKFLDYVRAKPDIRPTLSEGKQVKYIAPAGSRNYPYLPPRCREGIANPKERILIVEGEKKALRLDQEGYTVIGLSGVWNWCLKRETKKEDRKLIPELEALTWKERPVYIVFDSPDIYTKQPVRFAERDLSELLQNSGAVVMLVRIPPPPVKTPKWGADDFLCDNPVEKFDELLKRAEPFRPNRRELYGITNYVLEKVPSTNDKKPDTEKPLGVRAEYITRTLYAFTGGWPVRVGSSLFAANGTDVLAISGPEDLLAYAGRNVPNDHTGYPSVQWSRGESMVTRTDLYAHVRQSAQLVVAVETVPHEPPIKDHTYVHPPVRGGDMSRLGELVNRFSPASVQDRALMIAFLASLVWGGGYGQRPAWLFTTPDDENKGGQGVGKSTVPQLGGRLVGGFISADQDDSFKEVVTRLLSPQGRPSRLLLLDNIKSLRFSWGQLEGLITSDWISGKELYMGEGRRPNTLSVAITLNGASLGKDLSQRCVIIHVTRPKYTGKWREETEAFIDQYRWEIIGDLVNLLKQPAASELSVFSRWGTWECDVLAKLPGATELQQLITERQGNVDEDSSTRDAIKEAIAAELKQRGHDPERERIWIPTAELRLIVNVTAGEKLPLNKISGYVKALSIPNLRKSDKAISRGWCWEGDEWEGDPNERMSDLKPRYTPFNEQ